MKEITYGDWHVFQMMTIVFENIVGKADKMLVSSFFSFSHNVFKSFPLRVVKSRDCVVKS